MNIEMSYIEALNFAMKKIGSLVVQIEAMNNYIAGLEHRLKLLSATQETEQDALHSKR
jgi:prefoldin subunit 5